MGLNPSLSEQGRKLSSHNEFIYSLRHLFILIVIHSLFVHGYIIKLGFTTKSCIWNLSHKLPFIFSYGASLWQLVSAAARQHNGKIYILRFTVENIELYYTCLQCWWKSKVQRACGCGGWCRGGGLLPDDMHCHLL